MLLLQRKEYQSDMFEAEGRALGPLEEYNLLDEDNPVVTI